MAILTSPARHHARRRLLVLDPELLHDDPQLRSISHPHLEDRGLLRKGSVLGMGIIDRCGAMCGFIAIGVCLWTDRMESVHEYRFWHCPGVFDFTDCACC